MALAGAWKTHRNRLDVWLKVHIHALGGFNLMLDAVDCKDCLMAGSEVGIVELRVATHLEIVCRREDCLKLQKFARSFD